MQADIFGVSLAAIEHETPPRIAPTPSRKVQFTNRDAPVRPQIGSMINPATSAFTPRFRIIAYWVATALVVFELALGGAWDILHVPQVRTLIERLGYPQYFLTILGIWKLLGAVALLIPRFPRLKEWAYAGVFFDLTGAVASLWAAGLADAVRWHTPSQ